jgi:peroxiredoxin-like protein
MMQPFPHRYAVEAGATITGDVTLESERLPALKSASPAEFGGPGDRWSPETLVVAAVADCFVLTFRAIAGMSQLPWTSLRCEAAGTLDRVDRVTRFTEITVRARLQVPGGTDEAKARRLLEKTEQSCLISNSLNAAVHLEAEVQTERTAAA